MNVWSLFILLLVAVGVFFACRAFFVKKAGRCGGRGGCEGCALRDRCTDPKKK